MEEEVVDLLSWDFEVGTLKVGDLGDCKKLFLFDDLCSRVFPSDQISINKVHIEYVIITISHPGGRVAAKFE